MWVTADAAATPPARVPSSPWAGWTLAPAWNSPAMGPVGPILVKGWRGVNAGP